jgi:hypothetical protein
MKLLLALIPALFSLSVLAADPAGFQLRVAVDRPDAIYKVGEPVEYTISLSKDGEPVEALEVTWTLSKDGVPPNENGSAKLVGGKATASGTLAEPGFLLCRASFRETPQSTPITALGGAAIAPLEIQPSLPVPDDFEAFWKAQKEKLAAVPAKATLTPDPASTDTLEVFDVQVECLGAPVSGYFARPKGAAPKSRPAILTVHGAGVLSGNRSNAMRWGNEGALAMDINAHGIPNGKPAEFYKALAEGELKDYRFRGIDDRETNYFLGMFLRLVRAIDFLTAQPEWNGRDLDFNERLDARSTTDLLEAYYLDIAASEFGSWWTDEQDWPPIRSLNDFFEYFECAPSETVVDLAADDDYADPADEDDD